MLRLLRVFRVLRLGKYSNAFETFVDVLKSKKEELVITVIMAMIILIMASTVLYMAEQDAQPEKFGSIPDAIWWAVVTLATVGYGDVYPITPLGKFFAAIIALSAIGMFAIPAGILATGFAESFARKHQCNAHKTLACPQCGAVIDLQSGKIQDSATGPHKKDPCEEAAKDLESPF
jgi:voltage-gated potassium channel